MRKFIKYLSFCLILSVSFIACEPDDNINYDTEDPRDLGGYASLTTLTISQFDVDSDLNIDIFTASGVTAQTVEIIRDGAVIGTADVNGETATFSSSILGDIAAGTYPVRVRATFSNGNVAEQPFTITAVNSVSLATTNPDEATLTGIDTTVVGYSAYNLSATIDNVDLHLKKGSQGTYMDSGVDDIDGSVELGDTNYEELNLAVNDTLYYRFTATSGALSQSVEDYIVIVEEPEEVDEVEETDGDETDGDETGGDETDGDETDGDETDGDETDGDETDGDETDGDETDGDETDGDETDGDETDGDETDGDETDGDGTE